MLYANVDEFWEDGRGWKWECFQTHLPMDVLHKLAGFVLSPDVASEDDFCWGHEPNGNFSLASTYSAITPPLSTGLSNDWLRVWDIHVPQRICFFLWLVQHGRIMTNVERTRRKITTNSSCGVCAGQQEDLDHLFRHCREARGIWSAFLRPRVLHALDRLQWEAWFRANLTGDKSMGFNADWPQKFAICIWWIWKWRNEAVFNARTPTLSHKLLWITRQVLEVAAAFAKRKTPGLHAQSGADILVSWEKPIIGWAKINVDGSCATTNGISGCGGVLRDYEGCWKGGFLYKIGCCSVDEAEAWGVLQGLHMASRLGARKVIVESDSEFISELLQRKSRVHGNIDNIIQRCLAEGQRFEEVCFCHVY